MFKSLLASLGVGAAKIDLVLTQDHVTMGQETEGKIILRGGDVEQTIEGLYVDFRLNSRFARGEHVAYVNEKIQRVPIERETFHVKPGETLEFPFSFQCPEPLPVSSVNTRYYFETDLAIKSGLDAKDRDFVQVLPSGLLRNFLAGFEQLGFIHYAEGYSGSQSDNQVIQFQPTTWLRADFDEIVFSFSPRSSQRGIYGYFELDKRTSGVMGMLADELDLDEKKGQYAFSANQLGTPEKAAQTIRSFIEQNAQNLYG